MLILEEWQVHVKNLVQFKCPKYILKLVIYVRFYVLYHYPNLKKKFMYFSHKHVET